MGDLLKLAERCEQAAGPDRDIDGWIWAHLKAGEPYIIGNKPGRFPQAPIYGERADVMRSLTADPVGAAQYIGAPEFTASLDAAMTLVPGGRQFGCGSKDATGKAWAWCEDAPNAHTTLAMSNATTPALALTAACLKARDSGSDAERGDALAAPSEGAQSGPNADSGIAQPGPVL